MAIAYVNGNSAGKSGGGSVTRDVTKPVGLAVGDVMLALSSQTVMTATASIPGWTALNGGTPVEGGSGVRSYMWYKVADAADVAATLFTVTYSAGTLGSVCIGAWSGVDNTNPIAAENVTDDAEAASSPFTVPSVTTSVSSLVVSGISVGSATAITQPSGWSERLELSTSRGAEISDFNSDQAAGTLGPYSATGASITHVSWTVALAVATAAATSLLYPADIRNRSLLRR